MIKQKLGIDLDSTLNNLEEIWLKKYNEEYKDNLKEWSTWHIHNHVKPECGKNIFKYLHEPNFFYDLDIRENAKDVFEYLNEYFDIYIVTAYTVDTCVDKVNWVKKHLPTFNIENVIFCNDKSVLNLDYLIDDGPHNILGFKQIGIVYDMSYNINLPSNYLRVKNWLDIKTLFENNFIKK